MMVSHRLRVSCADRNERETDCVLLFVDSHSQRVSSVKNPELRHRILFR